MKYIFTRFKEFLFSKRARTMLIAFAIISLLWAVFYQEKNRIGFVEPKKPLYKVEKEEFDAIEYVEEVAEKVADFVVDEEEQTPAPIISSPSFTIDSYYSYEGVASAEQSFDELKPLQGELPILLLDIPTESGIDVGARISNPYYSDQSILVIEIGGLDYYDTGDMSLQNPNIVAFRDAFLAVKTEVAKYGVDLSKVRFNMGDRGHQLGVATTWLNFLKLIP